MYALALTLTSTDLDYVTLKKKNYCAFMALNLFDNLITTLKRKGIKKKSVSEQRQSFL